MPKNLLIEKKNKMINSGQNSNVKEFLNSPILEVLNRKNETGLENTQNNNKELKHPDQPKHKPLMDLFKEHMTNEMNAAIFSSIETPHLIL